MVHPLKRLREPSSLMDFPTDCMDAGFLNTEAVWFLLFVELLAAIRSHTYLFMISCILSPRLAYMLKYSKLVWYKWWLGILFPHIIPLSCSRGSFNNKHPYKNMYALFVVPSFFCGTALNLLYMYTMYSENVEKGRACDFRSLLHAQLSSTNALGYWDVWTSNNS